MYIEVSLKSAPMFAANFVSIENVLSDEYDITMIHGLLVDKKFIKGIVETNKVQFETLLATDDIARVTIVEKPVVKAPEKE